MRAAIGMCLVPNESRELATPALKLAELGASLAKDDWERAWCQQALGLARHRAGNNEEAEAALERADEFTRQFVGPQVAVAPGLHVTTGFIRCMVLWSTNRQTQAKQLFTELEAQMNPPADDRRIFEATPMERALMTGLAYREAKALLYAKQQ